MHPPETRAAALELIAAGVNDCEIARQLGVARTTIRDWRRPTYVPRTPYGRERCERCWQTMRPVAFNPGDYCELLGLYLGDGCIDQLARTQRMRIAMDGRYAVLNAHVYQLLERCFLGHPAGMQRPRGEETVVLSVHHKHLACLFPQHGPGKKHARDVSLEPWQEGLVASAPFALLRGLIWSDGCHFVNRTGRYEYFSYQFSNLSEEIIHLFVSTCERVGVECTRSGHHVWIRQRPSVELLVEHVGTKA